MYVIGGVENFIGECGKGVSFFVVSCFIIVCVRVVFSTLVVLVFEWTRSSGGVVIFFVK